MEICLMLVLLLPLAVEDLKYGRLHVGWMALVGAAGVIYRLIFKGGEIAELLPVLLAGTILWGISVKTDAVGVGDGILLMAVGAVSGFWECMQLFCLSLILCLIAGVILIVLRRSLSVRIPFAPVVLCAYLIHLAGQIPGS